MTGFTKVRGRARTWPQVDWLLCALNYCTSASRRRARVRKHRCVHGPFELSFKVWPPKLGAGYVLLFSSSSPSRVKNEWFSGVSDEIKASW